MKVWFARHDFTYDVKDWRYDTQFNKVHDGKLKFYATSSHLLMQINKWKTSELFECAKGSVEIWSGVAFSSIPN